MFKAPFSFEGRIRRTEFGLTMIIHVIIITILRLVAAGSSNSYSSSGNSEFMALYFIFLIPMMWFLWAQGAKRCHDLGNSGWWQLIPFYAFWLLFVDGQPGANQYGDNPKGIQNYNQNLNLNNTTQNNTSVGYQGGYNGGHNNPNTSTSFGQNQSNIEEYRSGDLYR